MDVSAVTFCLGSYWRQRPVGIGECQEVAEACVAQVREPAPDQGSPPWLPAGPHFLVALPVSRAPHRLCCCWLLWEREGSCTQETCVKPGQCWHLGGSRASRLRLVWGPPGRAELCLHLRAGEGVCLHHLPFTQAGWLS